MNVYSYISEAWKKPKKMALWKPRLIQWRREPVTLRIDYPTRLDRARALGYKAIKGMFIVRQCVIRGSHQRTRPMGRRSKTKRSLLNLMESYQVIAEKRATKKFPNCEVINSYWVGQDGKKVWYEIIIADRNNPDVLARMPWLSTQKGRAFRGLTSAGKKSRGLRRKGKGAEKVR